VLNSISPETKDSDFTWKDYQQKVNSELVSILGNFVNRVMVLTWKYFDGKVPSAQELPATSDKRKMVLALYHQTHTELEKSVGELIAALEGFRFREAQFQLMNLARAGNKFLADTEPWKLAKDDQEAVGSILSYALMIVGNLAIAAEPFLPDGSASIFHQLNIQPTSQKHTFWNSCKLVELLTEDHSLREATLLYRQVEDAEIEVQVEKLRKSKANKMESAPTQIKPLKPEIVFDDFGKIDIRIGTVTAAEKMPKSDKLLKLTVNTGWETRIILSGIAKHYTAEEMVGKQVTFVANLAPRKMMGTESQGMILMAEDQDGKLRLLQPNEVVAPGSMVS
jgi:methionyl-tRNA synthetase